MHEKSRFLRYIPRGIKVTAAGIVALAGLGGTIGVFADMDTTHSPAGIERKAALALEALAGILVLHTGMTLLDNSLNEKQPLHPKKT